MSVTRKMQWTHVGLLAVAVLLGANLLTNHLGAQVGPTPKVAGRIEGGLPDQGAQLLALIDQVKETNRKLDAMQKLLESGSLTVKTKTADEKTR